MKIYIHADGGYNANAKWIAPNGKKFGKMSRKWIGKFLFTKKELKMLLDSGIAKDLDNASKLKAMKYDVVGFSGNDSTGYRDGILIEDVNTGKLWVGNTDIAQMATMQ